MTETLDRRPLNCTCSWWTEYNNDGDWGGYVRVPNMMCPSWPHPNRFLTTRHRPDKVEPMTTDNKRTVYLSTPDIYENDLHNVVQTIDEIKLAIDRCEEVWLESAEIVLWSKNDYPIGTLTLDDDQWVFSPWNESNVEASIDVV